MYSHNLYTARIRIIVCALLLLVGLLFFSYLRKQTYCVTVTDKTLEQYINPHKHLVIADLQDGSNKTFSSEDDLFYWHWNSEEIYNNISVGKTYDIVVIGWDIPFFHTYKNIIEIHEH